MSKSWGDCRAAAEQYLQKIATDPRRVNDEVANLARFAIESLPSAENIVRGEISPKLETLLTEQLIAIDALISMAMLPANEALHPDIKLAVDAARKVIAERAHALFEANKERIEISGE